ncbi:MAG: serine hydrolase [Chloroflexota bacterium]
MLKAIRRFLLTLLLIAGALFLLFQAFLYYRSLDKYPTGTAVAGVPVAGLVRNEAAERLIEKYMAPVYIFHQDERVQVDPRELGFMLDVEAMLTEADSHKEPQSLFEGYAEFVIGRSLDPVDIPLQATVDEAALRQRVQTIADFLDQPAVGPQLLVEGGAGQEGRPGFITNVEASLPLVEAVLYETEQREAHLVIEVQPAPERNLEMLRGVVQNLLDSFDGFSSVFIMDLETGEELGFNADVALSGLSVLKIPIFVEAYAAMDQPPDAFVESLFYETAVKSSNYTANQLLHIIAGQDNTYLGADVFTQKMRDLGLVNTFMAVPYDAPDVATRPNTYVTPANSRTDINVLPDISRQTTAEEIGTLLSWIYYCAKGTGGTLMAALPGKITPQECQAIIDVLELNVEGNLIRYGVPEDVLVSHKHGWNFTDHSDAGIVFSPNRDYVLYIYMSKPGSDWLSSEISFPIIREVSRAVYNYFNYDAPYTKDESEARIAAAQAAAEAAAAADAAAESEQPVVGEEPPAQP